VTFTTFSTVVGWLAVALGTFAAYAQFTRLRRRGVEGVSLATWALFVYLAFFWILYGSAVHSWPLVMGSALALPLQVLILVRLRPWDRRSVVGRSFVFLVVCCAAPALYWGWAGAVLGAGGAGTITRVPQLIALIRVKGASGVSTGSWLVAAAVSVLWVIYYVDAHLWAVLVVTAMAGGVSLTIAALSGWRHRQMRIRSAAT
jgi:uncharacterized protein with PQ loop repeat